LIVVGGRFLAEYGTDIDEVLLNPCRSPNLLPDQRWTSSCQPGMMRG
jgi:hypothetical protein